MPSDEPFAPGPERVLSRSVTRFTLAYRDESGAWQDRVGRPRGGRVADRGATRARGGRPRPDDAGARGRAADGQAGPVMRAARPGRIRSDAGVALIVVLLLLALLLTIVAEFAQAMRLEAVTAHELPLRPLGDLARRGRVPAGSRGDPARGPDARARRRAAPSCSAGLDSAPPRCPSVSISGSTRVGSRTGSPTRPRGSTSTGPVGMSWTGSSRRPASRRPSAT